MRPRDCPRSAGRALRDWLPAAAVSLVVGLGLCFQVGINVAEGHPDVADVRPNVAEGHPADPPTGPMEEHEGVLEVLHVDRIDGERYLYTLETVAERLSLNFAADPPGLLSGSRVRVRGVRTGQTLALDSSASVQTVTAALPDSFGAQTTLVILVNFSDNVTQPYTADYARSVVFGTTSQFDLESSFQQTWLTGDVVGWFTIALSSTVCDASTLASQAKSAASAAGVNLSAYTRYVYAFPVVNACSWWGMGTVGGNPSQAWINGSLQLQVVGHEMGHNFGLYHSHALECGTTTLGTTCSTIEYGDYLDVMGNSRPGHYNAFQKERLGWLAYGSSPPITTVLTSGTYTIDPYEPAGTRPKALKILKSTDAATGARTWYYVEYRQAIGFDNFLAGNANTLNGVVIHTGSESSANSSYLLDLTPATSAWSDPALVVGQSFTDPDAGITITAAWATSSDAGVTVTLGPVPCARANPTVVLSPSVGPSVLPGTAVTYTVSVTNNDNAACTSTTFSLQPSAPAGWTAALANSSLTLDPGATASTTLQATSPTAAAEGSYTVGAAATNTSSAASTGSGTATYLIASCVHANPTVILSPSSGPSVSAGTAVTYTLSVTNNDDASCAPATFGLQPSVPAGWTGALGNTSLTLSPGATASTSLQVTSARTAAVGSYVVGSAATNNTVTTYTASGTGTYSVASSCVRSNPTVALSPSSGPSVQAGTAVTYTLSVTNNDNASCASATFGLQPSVPAGWTGALGNPSLTLSPGATASTTLQVTSASTATAGSYTIGASATNAGATSYLGSGSASYVIVSGTLSITVVTDRASYSRNQAVSITAVVNTGGSPVTGASVSFRVTKANGAVVTGTATTSSTGTATYTLRVAKKDPVGVYQVGATVNNGGSTASATTSFTVQ